MNDDDTLTPRETAIAAVLIGATIAWMIVLLAIIPDLIEMLL